MPYFSIFKSISTKKEFVRELEFFVDLSDSLYEPEDRIRVRLDIEKGKLLNVVCQYEVFVLYARNDLDSKWKFYKERYFERMRLKL